MPDTATEDQTQAPPPMTAAEAAKRVKRTVVEIVDGKDRDGNPVKKEKISQVALQAAEILSSRDYGTHVVVVTRDGQKFTNADA